MDLFNSVLEFIKNLDLSGIKDISEERLIEIKSLAEVYRNNIFDILDRFPIREVFYSTIARMCTHKELSIIITEKHFPFNNFSEALVFIIYAIDPKFTMAKKYTTFYEETNSKTKAILLHKQYAQQYHAFFESKILYGELLLQEKELTLESPKRKRTITE